MKQFADLIQELENMSKTNTKIEFLKQYFEKAPETDRVWTIALFTHRRPKRQVNTRMLSDWAMQVAVVEEWLFQESYNVVGDLAETIALILPPQTEVFQDRSLTDWITFLVNLTDRADKEKESLVKQAWRELPEGERFVFNKLITGGFRVEVSQNLIVKALAELYDLEPSDVAYALSGKWNPQTISFTELLFREEEQSKSRPYPFYLPYPIEGEIGDLGAAEEWSAEWKWDGIRSQLIIRDGTLFLWSGEEELITDKFPELHQLVQLLPDGTVIDGELLPFKEGQPLSFHLLQSRIGRKHLIKKHLKEAPASIFAYDLLEYEGMDIRQLPFTERRLLLSELIEQSLCDPLLKFSEKLDWFSWEELTKLREKSREHHAEGLMIKRKDSAYLSGRIRGDWWKWKVDPYSIDAVMIYAQSGNGKRAGLFSDYTFAVWKGEELVPFAKTYSGLTDKEMNEVTEFVRKHTLEKFGPVRTVTPTLVFEIHFDGINLSPRHKSGVALRFPRIHRWRRDKSAKEANTIEDLMILLN